MERMIGTQAHGIRLPIISKGDNLAEIVASCVARAIAAEGMTLKDSDVIGVTEAVVAKAQGNYVDMEDVASDIRLKFPDGEIGLVFPILSRNRFLNALKGISLGAKKIYLLLQYPSDEVGNPIMDIDKLDEIEDKLLASRPMTAADFKKITGEFLHPFTGIDYISLYEDVSPNISVYVSNDPRDILKLTKKVLVGEIHSRNRTKARLLKAGADVVYTLSDICAEQTDTCGYNPSYGLLGSNIAKDDTMKLFPRDCAAFVEDVRDKLLAKTGTAPEVMVYGDGAFKDPECGIWELADPVVSPAYTARLAGRPAEIKLKYVADNIYAGLEGAEKRHAVTEMIKEKKNLPDAMSEGTTPRKYVNLLGSLCDLMSGSGDKGTPVVLIKGYFDDYSDE